MIICDIIIIGENMKKLINSIKSLELKKEFKVIAIVPRYVSEEIKIKLD